MKLVPAVTSLQWATKNHLSQLPGPGSFQLQLTDGTVIQGTGRMQAGIMQKWVKAKAHQSLVLGYCMCVVLLPRSSNIRAYAALWSLSGISFLWKCNSKWRGACAKWRNRVEPACAGGAAKQGVSEGSVVYFLSIPPVSLLCDLKRGPFLECSRYLSSAM